MMMKGLLAMFAAENLTKTEQKNTKKLANRFQKKEKFLTFKNKDLQKSKCRQLPNQLKKKSLRNKNKRCRNGSYSIKHFQKILSIISKLLK